MNSIRVDRNDSEKVPCGMNSIIYIGDNMNDAELAFNESDTGKDWWCKSSENYGIILSIWDYSKNDYRAIKTKGLKQ